MVTSVSEFISVQTLIYSSVKSKPAQLTSPTFYIFMWIPNHDFPTLQGKFTGIVKM